MFATSIGRVALFIFLLATVVQAAADLSRRLKPLGPLGVRLDYTIAKKPETGKSSKFYTVVLSSYITFRQDVTGITDGQLFQIAKDAYEEMQNDLKQYKFGTGAEPKVMSALAIGNTIYFASSMKGNPSFTYKLKDSPVVKSLEICQSQWMDAGKPKSTHVNKGSCGEVMVAHIWYRRNPGVLEMHGRSAKIATVETEDGVVTIKDPCGDINTDFWGCNKFVEVQNMAVVPQGTKPQPYQLDTFAGGWVAIGQETLCS